MFGRVDPTSIIMSFLARVENGDVVRIDEKKLFIQSITKLFYDDQDRAVPYLKKVLGNPTLCEKLGVESIIPLLALNYPKIQLCEAARDILRLREAIFQENEAALLATVSQMVGSTPEAFVNLLSDLFQNGLEAGADSQTHFIRQCYAKQLALTTDIEIHEAHLMEVIQGSNMAIIAPYLVESGAFSYAKYTDDSLALVEYKRASHMKVHACVLRDDRLAELLGYFVVHEYLWAYDSLKYFLPLLWGTETVEPYREEVPACSRAAHLQPCFVATVKTEDGGGQRVLLALKSFLSKYCAPEGFLLRCKLLMDILLPFDAERLAENFSVLFGEGQENRIKGLITLQPFLFKCSERKFDEYYSEELKKLPEDSLKQVVESLCEISKRDGVCNLSLLTRSDGVLESMVGGVLFGFVNSFSRETQELLYSTIVREKILLDRLMDYLQSLAVEVQSPVDLVLDHTSTRGALLTRAYEVSYEKAPHDQSLILAYLKQLAHEGGHGYRMMIRNIHPSSETIRLLLETEAGRLFVFNCLTECLEWGDEAQTIIFGAFYWLSDEFIVSTVGLNSAESWCAVMTANRNFFPLIDRLLEAKVISHEDAVKMLVTSNGVMQYNKRELERIACIIKKAFEEYKEIDAEKIKLFGELCLVKPASSVIGSTLYMPYESLVREARNKKLASGLTVDYFWEMFHRRTHARGGIQSFLVYMLNINCRGLVGQWERIGRSIVAILMVDSKNQLDKGKSIFFRALEFLETFFESWVDSLADFQALTNAKAFVEGIGTQLFLWCNTAREAEELRKKLDGIRRRHPCALISNDHYKQAVSASIGVALVPHALRRKVKKKLSGGQASAYEQFAAARKRQEFNEAVTNAGGQEGSMDGAGGGSAVMMESYFLDSVHDDSARSVEGRGDCDEGFARSVEGGADCDAEVLRMGSFSLKEHVKQYAGDVKDRWDESNDVQRWCRNRIKTLKEEVAVAGGEKVFDWEGEGEGDQEEGLGRIDLGALEADQGGGEPGFVLPVQCPIIEDLSQIIKGVIGTREEHEQELKAFVTQYSSKIEAYFQFAKRYFDGEEIFHIVSECLRSDNATSFALYIVEMEIAKHPKIVRLMIGKASNDEGFAKAVGVGPLCRTILLNQGELQSQACHFVQECMSFVSAVHQGGDLHRAVPALIIKNLEDLFSFVAWAGISINVGLRAWYVDKIKQLDPVTRLTCLKRILNDSCVEESQDLVRELFTSETLKGIDVSDIFHHIACKASSVIMMRVCLQDRELKESLVRYCERSSPQRVSSHAEFCAHLKARYGEVGVLIAREHSKGQIRSLREEGLETLLLLCSSTEDADAEFLTEIKPNIRAIYRLLSTEAGVLYCLRNRAQLHAWNSQYTLLLIDALRSPSSGLLKKIKEADLGDRDLWMKVMRRHTCSGICDVLLRFQLIDSHDALVAILMGGGESSGHTEFDFIEQLYLTGARETTVSAVDYLRHLGLFAFIGRDVSYTLFLASRGQERFGYGELLNGLEVNAEQLREAYSAEYLKDALSLPCVSASQKSDFILFLYFMIKKYNGDKKTIVNWEETGEFLINNESVVSEEDGVSFVRELADKFGGGLIQYGERPGDDFFHKTPEDFKEIQELSRGMMRALFNKTSSERGVRALYETLKGCRRTTAVTGRNDFFETDHVSQAASHMANSFFRHRERSAEEIAQETNPFKRVEGHMKGVFVRGEHDSIARLRDERLAMLRRDVAEAFSDGAAGGYGF